MNTDHIGAGDFSRRNQWAYAAIVVVLLLAVVCGVRFATWLDGPGDSAALRLDSGWFYIQDGAKQPIESIPCTLEVSDGGTLVLTRALTDAERLHSRYVLTLRSRYASVRAWADDALIYEAAQGAQHALGSMWHFIPMSRCADADWLAIELRTSADDYTLESFLLDTPGAIHHELLMQNWQANMFSAVSVLLALIMLLAAVYLRLRKSQAFAMLIAFALFLLLSGGWVLLDSKITTLNGGNYALDYFLSYAVFYLMIVPFLIYVKLIARRYTRLLNILIGAFLLNAGLSLVLHMAGVIQIYRTPVIVHALIVVSLPVSTMALWGSVGSRRENRPIFTFLGLLMVYGFGLFSIALYHLRKLPPANSTQLYMIGLTLLIAGMAADMLALFSRYWRMQEYIDYFRRLAVEDSMTKIGNRNAFQISLTDLLKDKPEKVAFVVFDVDDLKQINDQMGHHVGDQAIFTAAKCIRTVFGRVGNCYRIGGDEFAVVLTGKNTDKVSDLLVYFQREIDLFWDARIPSRGVSYGWASASFSPETPVTQEDLTQLQDKADQLLYQNKKERKVGGSDL